MKKSRKDENDKILERMLAISTARTKDEMVLKKFPPMNIPSLRKLSGRELVPGKVIKIAKKK